MKIHPRCISSHLYALAFAGFTLMTMTTAAQAEPHVCPGGAGNGEVFLGMDPGGPGVAPAPLCDWASQGPAAAPKPRRDPEYWGDPNRKTDLPKGWTASVEGIDKPVLGVAMGKASRNEAIKAAMEDCRRQGATRCELLAATNPDE